MKPSQVKIVEAAVLGDAASAALQRAMPAAPPSPKANLRHMTYQRRAPLCGSLQLVGVLGGG